MMKINSSNGRTGQFPPENVIFGVTSLMASVRQKIEKITGTDLPVLIQGESGTGKDIVARIIHDNSPRFARNLVKVNCPAIPNTLIESELFGYEKGAFTGANNTKRGRVELADKGTLFLDEIGELDLGLQAKLLQLLQDGQFCPIGGQEERRVDVRVICATNRQLKDEVSNDKFRQDLFYRINVLNIQLPPLRDRSADIPVIAEYFLQFYNDKFNCRAKPLSSELLAQMQQYRWAGNIRELENLIKRYVVLGSEDVIRSEVENRRQDLFDVDLSLDGPVSLKSLTRDATRQLERRIILKVLESHKWHRKRAAVALNISYRALLYKIQQSGLTSMKPLG